MAAQLSPQGKSLLEIAEDFKEFSQVRGGHKVTIDWIGEGMSGDYSENVPGDRPVLRITVQEDMGLDGDWQERFSYATLLSPGISQHALLLFMDRVFAALPHRRSIEQLTWTEQGELEETAGKRVVYDYRFTVGGEFFFSVLAYTEAGARAEAQKYLMGIDYEIHVAAPSSNIQGVVLFLDETDTLILEEVTGPSVSGLAHFLGKT